MELKKVYKETLPAVKLVGKRFTREGMSEGETFAGQWQQAHRDGWFDTLKGCKGIAGVSESRLGAMRLVGTSGGFEYWIGAFMAPDTQVPDGFESADIPAGEVGVCWLCGSDKNGELYGQQASDLCMAALTEKGWRFSETNWFFERYNCPRFTQPDQDGNVILDICAYLDTPV